MDWAFRSQMYVTQAMAQLRLIRKKHVAEAKATEFLVHNFGSESERAGMKFGLVPDWAPEQAADLLDYDNKSPFAFTAGVGWEALKVFAA